jgi:predicted lipase
MNGSDKIKSAAVYYKAFEDQDFSEIKGNFDYIDDKPSDVQYELGFDGDKLIVIVGGTTSLKDLKQDLLFGQTTVPYDNKDTKIRVHRGFIGSYKYDGVRGRIHDTIKKYSPKSVFLTGHSYGGALVVLAAVDIQYNFNIPVTVVTFGCPKVGNKYFAESYRKRVPDTIALQNNNDFMYKMPPLIFGYCESTPFTHIGERRTVFNVFANFMKDHYFDEGYFPTIQKMIGR